MTKRDYQAIARAIHSQETCADVACCRQSMKFAVRGIMLNIADMLAADNPRFDRARFIEACETGKCKGMRPRQ